VRNRFPSPVFETLHLRLRVIEPGDEEFLASLDSDPVVMQYIHSGALSRIGAMQWAQAQIEMAPHRWHLRKWIVELRDSRTKVGWMELSKFRGVFDPAENSLGDDVSLGFELARAHWNGGLATEAARPIIAYAFETLGLARVVAFVHPCNSRSARVLEKLGFRQHASGRHQDEGGNECRLYALLADGWRP